MIFLLLTFAFLIGLCWGSFLNVLGYRITYDKKLFTTRSYCPHCEKIIYWYDNIPLLSWIFLRGKCRQCKAPISLLYPFTELVTGILFTLIMYKFLPLFFNQNLIDMYYQTNQTQINTAVSMAVYALFFSALVVATRTDLQAMVIPQAASLWLVPCGIICSYLGYTHISVTQSLLGALAGYGILWIVGQAFKYFTKRNGMGVGDMEFLCMIGSFLGPLGVWVSLMISSISGSLIGVLYLWVMGKDRQTHIPFGPFLALGATIYFFLQDYLLQFFY